MDISQKANRVLYLILTGLILILLRCWHLAIIQHEERLEESRKPQNRTVMETAKRGTIRDRFNIPLAINKIQYNAAVLYAPIRSIPSAVWENKVKVYKRKEHIKALSQLLAKELALDAGRVEDLIYSKASLYNQTPFVLKEDIGEEQYYRLKMLEREWPGIQVQKVPKRVYPHGRLAADIIGYMGAINRDEYETIFHKIEELKASQEDEERLRELEERAYTINDYVGKTGVEAQFEEQLKGFRGKRSYHSDARGNFLRETAGSKDPLSGKRILLTISAELQQYAEELLMESEHLRKARISGMSLAKQDVIAMQDPWIKGGAIVAMDPNTGEVLAMASYPRMDSNDFSSPSGKGNIGRWYESESHLADLWDQRRPLEREVHQEGRFREEKMWLTWSNYLKFIIPERNILGEPHEVHQAIKQVGNIKNAYLLQRTIDKLLILSGNNDITALLKLFYSDEQSDVIDAMRCNLEPHEKFVTEARQKIDPFLSEIDTPEEQSLVIDLCRLAVADEHFDEELLEEVGSQSLEKYRDVSAAFGKVNEEIRQMAKTLFHEIDFSLWREKEGKEYLKKKRMEEKAQNRYARPYIDYLDRKESELFEEFWKERRWSLAAAFLWGEAGDDPYNEFFATWHNELKQGAHQAVPWREAYDTLVSVLPKKSALAYVKSMRSFKELTRPLLGKTSALRKSEPLEKDLAAAFYPRYGFGYGRSYAYRQAAQQGSIFKLVTAYEALLERYNELFAKGEEITLESLNPLEIVDTFKQRGRHKVVGYHVDGKPINQIYKGGRIPKSALRDIGHVNILGALEYSSNPYFSLLAGEVIKDPDNLLRAAKEFSYGDKTGIDLPSEIKGQLPRDLKESKTGLYSFGIGHHTFVSTPLQTAVMLSTLANGGKVLRPKILRLTAQEQEGKCLIAKTPVDIKRELLLPPIIRQILLEGMERVIKRAQVGSLSSLVHLYRGQPQFVRDFVELKNQLVGKSSTSELVERVNLDPKLGLHKFNHVWFGGISFEEESVEHFGNPELVVVVYMRFGEWGKDTAPIAGQVIKKWREIKAKYPTN